MEVLIYIASLMDTLADAELPVGYAVAAYWVMGAIVIMLIASVYD